MRFHYSRLQKLEYGPGTSYGGFPSSLGFGVGGGSYSNFLASTVALSIHFKGSILPGSITVETAPAVDMAHRNPRSSYFGSFAGRGRVHSMLRVKDRSPQFNRIVKLVQSVRSDPTSCPQTRASKDLTQRLPVPQRDFVGLLVKANRWLKKEH